jgi:hypothetical protein
VSFNTLTPAAVSSEARPWAGTVWRMVEAQHTASTMKIVDNSEEQDLLETLLEGSKPTQPASAQDLDYLLATPFRYYPLRGGSRFRAVTDPGVFYGAESARTASAELGYWRWKFLKDAVDLDRLEPVAHTAFSAQVSTQVIDLRQAPFGANTAAWTHPATTPLRRPSPRLHAQPKWAQSNTSRCATPTLLGAWPCSYRRRLQSTNPTL